MKISTGTISRPQKVVLYGPEGIGKTTLASKFPDPLFIDTEGSTAHIDVKRADPAPSSWSMLMAYVGEVIANPSLCKTLVIDTADWAERLCVEHVLVKNGWATIEAPGYGKGYREVNEEFGRLLDKLSDAIEHGVNVVVTAHARIAKFEQPDELGAYDRWSLKLFDSPKSSNAAMLKEWADMVLFLNYKTEVVKTDAKSGGKTKAVGGRRVMYTTHTPAWDAKNRCGLADELPMDYASIAQCFKTSEAAAAPSVQPAQVPTPEPDSNPALTQALNDMVTASAAYEQTAKKQAAPEETTPQLPLDEPTPPPEPAAKKPVSKNYQELWKLMVNDGVTAEEIEAYSVKMGYCTPGTAMEVYPDGYFGHLVTNWAEIKEQIKKDEIEVPFS